MEQHIRARVYELQQGDFISDYVRYFASLEDVDKFIAETGFKVEVENVLTPSKTIHGLMGEIERGAAYLQRLIDTPVTDLLSFDGASRFFERKVYQCTDCGEVYFEGEDRRVEVGLKCAQCAYPQGDNF